MSRHPRTLGFNHVATMTADLDRYLAFYGEIFGAEVLSIMEAEGDHPRMAIVNMGGDSALNVFEVPPDSIVGDRAKMGGRGPIDHYALAVESEERAPGDPGSSGRGGSIARRGHPVRTGPAFCVLPRSGWRRTRGRISRCRRHGGSFQSRVAARLTATVRPAR